MNKVDWKRKLTSRKFWSAAVAFVTAVCSAFGLGVDMTGKVVLVVTAVGSLCVYMLAEGMSDSGGGTNAAADSGTSNGDA